MKRNMLQWLEEQRMAKVKRSLPILSFPCIQLIGGINVTDLISNSDEQAKGMKLIADKCDCAASVSFMDLAVEAECFGAEIKFSVGEAPSVTGRIITDMETALSLEVPSVGSGRTPIHLEAASKAVQLITDRPVFGGTIGPLSLTGRLVGVSEVTNLCYEEPGIVHEVLKKSVAFLIDYAKEYKKTGVNGIIMFEPVTGMLSPDLAREFSEPYVREVIKAVKDECFAVIYHNCGSGTIQMIDSILNTGADAFHFGSAIDMEEMIKHIPENIITMGNISPVEQFRGGTPESIRQATLDLLAKCGKYPNFIISSGCDVPPLSSWDNINSFFAAVSEFYSSGI